MEYALDNVHLAPHPIARTQATAARLLRAGAIVLAAPALTTALIPSQKGERCDHCHRAPAEGRRLSKCTGCAAFWYCGTACQTKQWHAHHRRICRRYNSYAASPEWQAMPPEQRTDALLLSQLLLEAFPKDEFDIAGAARRSDAVAHFFDLRKGPVVPDSAARIPLCRPSGAAAAPQDIVEDVFARFGNNNFVVQSHLNAYAHGVFPLASRVFNHSCVPNCVPKYIITPTELVTMEIVALRDVDPGEELTLPYLDPALPFDIRQRALQESYGFACNCALCTFQRAASPLPPLPAAPAQLAALETRLCQYVSAHVLQLDPSAPPPVSTGADAFSSLPRAVLPLLGAGYLPALSERFSQASHEGPYDQALPIGRVLLALYAVLYPPNYPQIGLHALELAKTAWNATVADARPGADMQRLEDAARHYLALAARVLGTYGPEGDAGGPLEELRALRELLA
ncbi:SET domain-containing protein [Phanerochaete sordida]|uniref:SET domain-containing protein n=1 Tax=Phanerochaete sordida TaxID=48140 RepID=A0A9P3GSL6_9APHY|nr:SET domain-containing protein [Phanerochaete sordida]